MDNEFETSKEMQNEFKFIDAHMVDSKSDFIKQEDFKNACVMFCPHFFAF